MITTVFICLTLTQIVPIPYHAYVASNGSDSPSAHRGSITDPYLTVPAAVAAVATVPTSQVEYLQPRVVEVIGPGTYTGDASLPTLANVSFVFHPNVTWTGKVTWFQKNSERFGSTAPPALNLIGPAVRSSMSLGNGTEAVVVTGDILDRTTASLLNLTHIRTNGAVVSDGISWGLTATVKDCSLSATSGLYSLDLGVESSQLTLFDSLMAKETRVWKLRSAVSTQFNNRITLQAGGSDGDRSTTGMRDCLFSAATFASVVREIHFGAPAPLRLDASTNYALKIAGWKVTPADVVIQFQDDMTPIVPVP